MSVVVRTDADATRFAGTLRGVVAGVDRDVPVSQIRGGEQLLRDSMAPQRFSTVLLGLFAVVAVVLAGVGVYGVISYSVARRTREIGIRMALGARALDVVFMVVRKSDDAGGSGHRDWVAGGGGAGAGDSNVVVRGKRGGPTDLRDAGRGCGGDGDAGRGGSGAEGGAGGSDGGAAIRIEATDERRI